jgi:hypothetical protein
VGDAAHAPRLLMDDGDNAIRGALGELEQITTWASEELPPDVFEALLHALDQVIALCRTIAPELHFARSENTGQIESDWDSAVASIQDFQAKQLSERLVHVSTQLAECFGQLRRCGRDDVAVLVRDAMGYLYADLLRPLWVAFPGIEPAEMKM